MTLTRRNFIAGSTLSLSSTKLWSQTGDIVQIEGPAFGARWRAILPLGIDADLIASKVGSIIKSVDSTMSPFNPTSEISVFNSNQTTRLQRVSAGILTTVNEAKRTAQFTQGAFDPTLGGVVGRYGFGPINSAPVGAFKDLAVSRAGLQKSQPQQTLDLCGIAKGFALDQIATTLTDLGYNDYFVELGGEVFARGFHPDRRPWMAGIERPVAGQRTLQRTIPVNNEVLATSGDLVNSYRHANQRYSHIIDPHTQHPTNNALASVSVFAPRAITADALATALFAMGPQIGFAFAQDYEIPAMFLVRDQRGLQEMLTDNFSARESGKI